MKITPGSKFNPIYFLILILLYIGISACGASSENIQLPTPIQHNHEYTQTPTLTATQYPTYTATINPLVTLTPTIDPFLDLYIDTLKARKYGGGVLQDIGDLNGTTDFIRKLFKYRSEGLNLYGFINIPNGEGPFPIIVMLHGYVDPAKYSTLDYSVRYADVLAESGYIVLHPNLQGYSPSEGSENVLGIGDTIDVLNLLALIRQQSGSAGLLEKGDGERIGLWGHSMGGGILIRALIIDQEIRGGVLYASIHTNEEFNLAHFEKDGRGNEKLIAPSSALSMISPYYYLEEINSPISIHHGSMDDVVPALWSNKLCDDLSKLGKVVKCREYPDQPHTFQNKGDTDFISEMIVFFNEYVKE